MFGSISYAISIDLVCFSLRTPTRTQIHMVLSDIPLFLAISGFKDNEMSICNIRTL